MILLYRQILLLVIQSVVCLTLMRVLSPGVMEKCVLGFAMAFLCVCHLYRMYHDYAGYTLDITGLVLSARTLTPRAYIYIYSKTTLLYSLVTYVFSESVTYVFSELVIYF